MESDRKSPLECRPTTLIGDEEQTHICTPAGAQELDPKRDKSSLATGIRQGTTSRMSSSSKGHLRGGIKSFETQFDATAASLLIASWFSSSTENIEQTSDTKAEEAFPEKTDADDRHLATLDSGACGMSRSASREVSSSEESKWSIAGQAGDCNTSRTSLNSDVSSETSRASISHCIAGGDNEDICTSTEPNDHRWSLEGNVCDCNTDRTSPTSTIEIFEAGSKTSKTEGEKLSVSTSSTAKMSSCDNLETSSHTVSREAFDRMMGAECSRKDSGKISTPISFSRARGSETTTPGGMDSIPKDVITDSDCSLTSSSEIWQSSFTSWRSKRRSTRSGFSPIAVTPPRNITTSSATYLQTGDTGRTALVQNSSLSGVPSNRAPGHPPQTKRYPDRRPMLCFVFGVVSLFGGAAMLYFGIDRLVYVSTTAETTESHFRPSTNPSNSKYLQHLYCIPLIAGGAVAILVALVACSCGKWFS